MVQQKIDVTNMTDKCAVKSCKWISHAPNNENALDIILQGGYGDFVDYFGDEAPPYFRLCHKHAHNQSVQNGCYTFPNELMRFRFEAKPIGEQIRKHCKNTVIF